ncbi:pentapeptide repeat-containing protein [bacterium]|nr:pentapeptide repeat-containing protein [bacterium]
MPDHLPQYDDEEPLGVSFFRTFANEDVLENLTIPRTFFGRSEMRAISFLNSDLSESNLCWNDFIEVNFECADLGKCDMRASLFEDVRFVRANLCGADLRQSTFDSCDFTEAAMKGAKLTRKQAEDIRFSDEQRGMIDWQDSEGEEPPGG